MTSIALAIPHTPWVPARVASMQRVRDALALNNAGMPLVRACDAGLAHYREFTDRESNKVWPRKMWGWMLETGADWCITLQDDVLVAPCFWPALRAMLPHVGKGDVLGLSAVHPMGPEIARQGHRWYRTRSWLVGWAYAMRRADLAEFVAWYDAHPELVATCNEDDLVNRWVGETGRSTWHPVPTIVDHDTSIESTYANDAHSHRRSAVTWRDFGEGSLIDPAFWLPSGEPTMLPVVAPHNCWYCLGRPGHAASTVTGARICRHCAGQIAAALIGG